MSSKLIRFLFFGLFFSFSVFGELIITQVLFQGHNDPYVREKLNALPLNTQVGNVFSATDIQSDLSQIYLTGAVQKVSYEPVSTRTGVKIIFVVTPNPIPTDITFENNTAFSHIRLKTHLKTTLDHPLRLDYLDRDKAKLTEFYRQYGYDLFRVESIQLTSSQNVHFVFDEGPLNQITYSGLSKIKPFVIEREMRLKPGMPYNRLKLLEDRQRLLNLGYFSEVSHSSLNRTADGADLHLTFRERKSNIINLGLEQDQEDVVAFVQTKVNHAFMHSDYIAAKTQIEFEEDIRFKSYLLSYHQTWLLNKYDLFFTANAIDDFRTDPLNQTFLKNERIGGDATIGKPLLDDRVIATMKYKKQHVIPVNDGDFEAYNVTSLTWGLRYQVLDNIFNPTEGVYAQLDYEKSGKIFGVSVEGVEFDRLNLNAAIFYSIKPGQVLAGHGFWGRVNQITKTFDGENYSLGGPNSLRGYSEQAFFGSRRLLTNWEYRYRLSKTFQAVAFWDAGAVFEEEPGLTSDDIRFGRGFGLRYLTPIGPLRFDFAWGDAFHIHFNIGHVF